ncbi:MAG: TPM domain-containing protein [Paludibacteraceae bacterium]|nr:TPM domain-containing protein [Paludibacteraceae bacterium]
MKKILSIFIVLLSFVGLHAKQYGVDNIEMVHLQDASRYVCNPENILSWDSVAVMDALLGRLEDSTGIEVVVVAVDSLANHDCYETAIRLGQKYGVGKSSLNNGLVILLSTQERCVQFSTGSGLEGYLPDAICKRIQMSYMTPRFKEGDWSGGMTMGVRVVYDTLQGSMTWEEEEEDLTLFDYLFFFGILFFFPFIALYSWWKNKKCPNCGKHSLKQTLSEKVYSDKTMVKYKDTYVCGKCGKETTRLRTIYKSTGTTRRSGGYGGGFGGGFGGGRSSGGHFGGGHFGGGGAGSRF